MYHFKKERKGKEFDGSNLSQKSCDRAFIIMYVHPLFF